MKLRAAGQAQILTHESGFLSRIASEAGQFIKPGSPGLGLAGNWPYHLSGRSPRPRSERVPFPLDSIIFDEDEGRRVVRQKRKFLRYRKQSEN